MASFHTKTFTVHDNYMTPKHAWEAVQNFIPKDKVIWESFAGNGNSSKFLTELGFDVICKEEDFFNVDYGDIIVTNPPFSKKKEVFTRLKQLDKPFVIICPCSMITSQYFRNLFKDEKIQIIIPRKRIHFLKTDDDGNIIPTENKCNFDCFYYCWKMNLPKDIVWLE
tara:strand:- start:649 stop:1149 length:501 start_codon:yes stop_codon:yes gene_type:complete